MNKLETLLNQLEAKIPYCDKANLEISNGNISWHIEHSFLTINAIIDAMKQSNPEDYHWRFIFDWFIIKFTKKIPRGRAKSPKVVQPKEGVSAESLHNHLSFTRNKLKELQELPKNKYFKHPFFGDLKRNQAAFFLEIHTKHHLDIISDIFQKN